MPFKGPIPILGPHYEEIIRRAAEDARRLEREDFHRPDVARWERGEDEYHRVLGEQAGVNLAPLNLRPIPSGRTSGRQEPNVVITEPSRVQQLPPRPPPYEQWEPKYRPPLGQPRQPRVGENPRPAPGQG